MPIINYPFWNNINTNSGTDGAIFFSQSVNPIAIQRVSAFFRIGTSSVNPSVSIRDSANGGGNGISIALAQDLTTGYYIGTGTGALTIGATGNLYCYFLNCNGLGDGGFTIEANPTAVALPGISDDDLRSALNVALGREITDKELSIWIRRAGRWIQNSGDLKGYQKTTTFTTSGGNTGKYAISSIASDIKNIASIYIDYNNTTRYHVAPITNRDNYNRARILNGEASDNQGLPRIYNIWNEGSGDYIYVNPDKTACTLTFDYYAYLPDITGTSTNYIYTNFGECLIARVLFYATMESGKQMITAQGAGDLIAKYYEGVSEKELNKALSGQWHTEYGDQSTRGIIMNG